MGEVAQMLAGARLDLLGVEVERAGERQQPFTQLPGAGDLTDLHQRRDQPERADDECAFLTVQSIVGLLDPVAQHQAVFGELIGDRQHGGTYPRVVGGQEAEQHGQQQRRVQRVGAVALNEHASGIDAVLQDVGPDFLGDRAPFLHVGSFTSNLGQFRATVQRDPAHDLRRREVLGLAADFPDPAVRVAPVLDRLFDLLYEHEPQRFWDVIA